MSSFDIIFKDIEHIIDNIKYGEKITYIINTNLIDRDIDDRSWDTELNILFDSLDIAEEVNLITKDARIITLDLSSTRLSLKTIDNRYISENNHNIESNWDNVDEILLLLCGPDNISIDIYVNKISPDIIINFHKKFRLFTN
jgi:hypothetical protein